MGYDLIHNQEFLDILKSIAPGTEIRIGMENILRAKTGGLIIIGGDDDAVMKVVDGGFEINADFTPNHLYELAKMDGALILSGDAKKILRANAQLVPDPTIPTSETGTRHRNAERVAKQTGKLVISISQRRNIITLYMKNNKYVLKNIRVVLDMANQALQTLEKYKTVMNHALNNMNVLEFENQMTINDVVLTIQRMEMVLRISREINYYICELGVEGRLVQMQLSEILVGIEQEASYIVRDYRENEVTIEDIVATSGTKNLTEGMLDLNIIIRSLGYPPNTAMEQPVSPKGYRLLNKIPRLPNSVIDNLVEAFGNLESIMVATISQLDDVEGIGEVRARNIVEGLKRLKDLSVTEQYG